MTIKRGGDGDAGGTDGGPRRGGRRGRMKCGFRVFEHTADVGLTIWGETLADLFACAADGLVRVAVSKPSGRAAEDRVRTRRATVNIPPAPDIEALLIDWLNSLVYLMETEGYYPCGHEIEVGRAVGPAAPGEDSAGAGREEAGGPYAVTGEIIVRAIPGGGLRVAVKGATYHGLKVTRSKEGQYRARVILDV